MAQIYLHMGSLRTPILCLIAMCASFTAVMSQAKAQEPPLKLSVAVDGSLYRGGEGSKIHISLKNTSAAAVRIMDVRDRPSLTRVFFLLDMSDIDGTLISGMMGGAKADIPLKWRTYIVINPGEETRFDININDLLPARYGRREGTYDLRLTYFSQYGDGFRGTVPGEPFRVSIIDAPEQ